MKVVVVGAGVGRDRAEGGGGGRDAAEVITCHERL